MKIAVLSESKQSEQYVSCVRQIVSDYCIDAQIKAFNAFELFLTTYVATGQSFDMLIADISNWPAEKLRLLSQFRDLIRDSIIVLIYDVYGRYDLAPIIYMKAFDALPKPLGKQMLSSTVRNAFAHYLELRHQFLDVSRNGSPALIRWNHIRYIESDRRMLSVFTDDGKPPIKYYESLSKVECKLKPFGFYCIMKGVLVNTHFIKEIDSFNREVVFDNDERLPISRDRLAYFKEYFRKSPVLKIK